MKIGKPAAAAGLAAMLTVPLLFAFDGNAQGSYCALDPAALAEGPSPQIGNIQLDKEQTANARVIVGVIKTRRLSERAAAIALMTAMPESSLRNMSGGHLDSLGLFQQRPSQGWGTPAQIRDPVYATGKFIDGLVTVPGWHVMPMWQAAQAVQLSADGTWYQKWERFGVTLAAGLYSGSDEGLSCTDQTPDIYAGPAVAGAIGRARTQLGVPYSWGGGGPAGPSEGFAQGVGTRGFDCSSLMQFAWWPWIHLPRTSQEQFHAGRHVVITQAQPGDLLFWAHGSSPTSVYHVAMYIGNGQLLEAPRTELNVRTRPISFKERKLLPVVVRLTPPSAPSARTAHAA